MNAMLLDWFNAREATSVGSSLADSILRSDTSRRAACGNDQDSTQRAEVQRLLRQAVLGARPLKLNLFKRAKLLGSFKWRLIEQGVEQGQADALTHLLLLQLSGGAPLSSSNGQVQATRSPRKRIDPLLSAADADLRTGDYSSAAGRLQEVLGIDPNHALARNRLGETWFRMGRYAEAEQEFRHAIQLKSSLVNAQFNLGTLLRWRGEFAASEAALRRVVKQDPGNAEALVGLGHTLSALQRFDEVRACFKKAHRLQPRNAAALCALGWLARTEGRFGDAEVLLRSAIDADPNCTEAYAWLGSLRRMSAADHAWREGVERLLSQGLPPVEEATLRFALGKYFDDTGKFREAFEQYRSGNSLRRGMAKPYDRAARAAFVDERIRVFTRDRLIRVTEGISSSDLPVFVTGMPRSGTSLVEQIIASHPRAAGGGELEFWNRAAFKHQDALRRDLPDSALAARLAGEFLKMLERERPGAARIVDKATVNSDHLGLIHAVLPRARIIYLQRDPVDTCLSSYFQDFANAAAFSMDLEDLAHYYREHHRLVTHWRSVLPQDVFLEVPYAELVDDQEAWSRRIFEFIGLEWDPRVLEFDKTERAVLTASSWQVRQKVYASSVGRWKNYQKFIGPLLKLRELA